jgi:hypothetical protein
MPDAQLTNKLSPREAVRPRCPVCRVDMQVLHIAQGRPGFQHFTLRCLRCGIIHDAQAPSDPINAESLGWCGSELRPPR